MCKSTRYLYLENPDVFKQIHPTKNEGVDLMELAFSTHKKIWWLCLSGHSYDSTINSRTNNETGCPYCSNNKLCQEKCLGNTNSELSKEWHPTKNGTLTPFDIARNSNKKVWWKCDKEHEWEAKIGSRNFSSSGCPTCNRNGTSDIERKFYYYLQLIFKYSINCHKIKNNKRNVEIDIFIPELNLAIEYDGVYFHKNEENIKRDIFKNNFLKEKQIPLLRIREFGLNSIHNIEFNYDFNNKKSFKITLTEILDYIKNNFTINENQKQKIEEVKNIDYENHIIPKGFFIYPLKEDSLLIKNPELSKQWHTELNGDLKPEHVSCCSHKKVWWKCDEEHEWNAVIKSRNYGSNCPTCHRLKHSKKISV